MATVKTPHKLRLTDGSVFLTEAHVDCPDRHFDGVDYLYFETYDDRVPLYATKYHQWDATTKVLSAWVIPVNMVSSIVAIKK